MQILFFLIKFCLEEDRVSKNLLIQSVGHTDSSNICDSLSKNRVHF